jgi:hypothetical protein
MPQSPQNRPLVQSTRTKYFTRTLAQNTSLEHYAPKKTMWKEMAAKIV